MTRQPFPNEALEEQSENNITIIARCREVAERGCCGLVQCCAALFGRRLQQIVHGPVNVQSKMRGCYITTITPASLLRVAACDERLA